MDETPEEPGARNVTFLRALVTVLTIVLIGGVLAIVTLLVIRLNDAPLALPSEISLPGGARATALTQGQDWYAVVTDADEILIFDRLTGALRQRVTIETAP